MFHRFRWAGAVVLLAGLVACSNEVVAPIDQSDSVTLASSTAYAKGGGTCTLANGNVVSTGFDVLGYNRCAGIFNGLADGTDKVLDGKVWGDPTYANDHLLMKWNAAWDACNANRNPANCAGAWTSNEWNGKVPGGSGEVWHYKMKWVGSCGAYGTSLPDGGYCIWNEYEVVLSQGSVANQHFWDAHAKPAGYGN
ncbi:MAG: hypothetical protein WC783_02260 [Candidatus Paceibacterota bacterium]|jgi:hypothetical protein